MVKTRWSWKQGGYCITGILGDADVPHENFSTSCVKGLSPLWWRIPILLWALIIIFWSMAFFWGPTEKFFLYMTHWGLFFIVVETVFGIIVTVKVPRGRQPSDGTFGLPWYVKAYWISYNVTLPIAFFITLFYWVFLTELDDDYAINLTLDIFIHAINSVLMLILLASNRHPTRILHFYFSVLAGIIYLIFSVIFHFAGGVGPFGSSAIYPMLDWNRPGLAAITAVGSAVGIIVMHLVVVGLTAARDALTKSNRENSASLSISNERYY